MSIKTLPVIDEIYTQRVFSALGAMEVSLDADPLAHGPKRMNAKIAVCRNHLDRCQQIYLQMSNDLHVLNRAMRLAKVEFDLRMQDMLTNDPETRAGRSVRDREAIATMKIRDEREAMATIESSISDLDAVMTVVKAKRDDLKDILGRIRDQLKLCQEEIGLGNRWGTAPAPGARIPNRDHGVGVDPLVLAAIDSIPAGEAEVSLSDLERFVHASLTAQGRVDEILVEPEEEPTVLPDPPAEIIVSNIIDVSNLVVDEAPAPVVAEAPTLSESDAEFDSFLNDLDDKPTKGKVATPFPAVNPTVKSDASDIDLDDLIGSLV
jgi:hypothetical protein